MKKCELCNKQTTNKKTLKVIPPMVEIILGINQEKTITVCKDCYNANR